ncbi:MAG: hypothetical protein AAGJ94_06320 [Pseudomonadota bacterium]
MGVWTRAIVPILSTVVLAGCVYSKAVPIGNNAWRLETDGRGAIGQDIALNDTLRDAATLTLQQGYTHFLLSDAPEGPGDIGIRAILYGNTRTVAFASNVPAPPPPPPSDRPPAPVSETPLPPRGGEPGVRTAVTVIMLRRDDPRTGNAYDALKVLAGTSTRPG